MSSLADTQPCSRTAHTAVPLHPVLAERWSPRGFDPTAELSDEQLTALLEAARWAPSANNRQPWRFLVGRRGDPTYKSIFDVLMPGNQTWASGAAALILAVAQSADDVGRPLAGTEYDLGLAAGQLTLQAHAAGLHVHQMGGFSRAAARAAFEIPGAFTPVVVLAVGVLGDPETLTQQLREREQAPRVRRPLAQTAYAGTWGSPAPMSGTG